MEGRIREAIAIFFLTVIFLPAFFVELYEMAKTPEEKQHLESIGDNVFAAIDIQKWGKRVAGLITVIMILLGFWFKWSRRPSSFP